MEPSALLPNAVGGPYPWITKDMWRISCKSSTKNGYPGQAFIATSPSGIKYHLDWVVAKTHSKVQGELNSFPVHRQVVYFLATRVEDRFGNSVDYTYSGDKLTGISSSDNRHINLTWSGNKIATATSTVGDWSYVYTGEKLSHVTQPDTSKWSYLSTGGLKVNPPVWTPVYEDPTGCPEPVEDYTGNYELTITAPSGATGKFSFVVLQHHRGNIPEMACYINSPQYWFMKVPRSYWSLTLTSKVVTGPGLPMMSWGYSYDAYNPGFIGDYAKHNIVLGPSNKYTRYTYGTGYNLNEGQLLVIEEGSSSSSILQTRTNTYLTAAETAGQNFPSSVGANPRDWSDLLASAWLRPVKQTVTNRQSVDFNWHVDTCSGRFCFDVFARPTKITKASTVAGNPTRTEQTSYHDNASIWVLGQVAEVRCVAPTAELPAGCGAAGLVMLETSYDASSAVPLISKRFGKVEQSVTWDTTSPVASHQRGTVRTVADGKGNTLTLTGWKRGIPESIKYPATPEAPLGASQSALVNNAGWITSVTDEKGAVTGYGYDAMGRLASVVHATDDGMTWNTTTQVFQQVTGIEYGIPGGHWRQTISTGNGRKITYFDGLWRPLVTREYDSANESGTQRFKRFAYDDAGHTTFVSYPAAVHNPAIGIWSEHDTLGRPVSLTQDSERGLLNTFTTYLAGFQTRVVNPEGYESITRHWAWDAPTTDYPVAITHPEGAFTDLARDVLGKPTAITRRDTTAAVSLTRTYAYNAHQELCRSVEPETGATLMGYDEAGNLAWSAAGLPADAACHDTGDTSAISPRRVDRNYDARNRFKTLVFPDGNGNQAWDYFPDGKPRQITTWNIGFEGAAPQETRNLYTYYNRGLLKTELIALPAWYTFSVGHGYNANGHETLLTYPSTYTVTSTVNALGQPTAISGDGATYASGITYHANGAVAGFHYGNNIVHSMVPNDRQLPATVSSIHGGSQFLHDEYKYDGHGNVQGIIDVRPGESGRRSRAMTYDGLDRLKSVASPMYGSTGAHYTYNELDDVTRVQVGGASARDHKYHYDANHRLTNIRAGKPLNTYVGLGYDSQGNLANRNGQLYRFDYGNRLREVEGVERYRYDGHGRRVLAMQFAQGTVLSQYGLDGKLLYQKSDRTQLQTDSIYLGGTLLAMREAPFVGGTAVVKYQHTDALGSPVVVTLQDRSVVEETEYEPYGKVLNRPAHDGPGYTGHVEDAATGLVYMQQRYYDPGIGRFLSVDPIAANPNTGASFNRYAYVLNNPYKFTDPDGRCEKVTGSRICGGGAGSNVSIIQVGPPSVRAGDNSPRGAAPAAQNQGGAAVPNMRRVTLPGLGNSFLDSGMAARVDTWSQGATQQGVNLSFNSAFRDQGAQNALRGDPNAITPATTSLHSAGFCG